MTDATLHLNYSARNLVEIPDEVWAHIGLRTLNSG